MPQLTKDAFSRFIRTDCQRQLRLALAVDAERQADDMPGKQPPRPGLEEIAQQGIEWQNAKVVDLENVFGATAVIADAHVSAQSGRTTYRTIDLGASLTRAAGLVSAGTCWLVEAQFEITRAFETALGIEDYPRRFPGFAYSALRPDLIEVLPSGTYEHCVSPDGVIAALGGSDARLQLRVVDIKLTAEPSAGYFAEVVLYSMALAAWLREVGRDGEFVVVPDAALWPGSHDASNLARRADEWGNQGITPTHTDLRDALEVDLESVPFEVFAPRVRKFFVDELPEVLTQPWTDLEWHVDNRCKGCSFLGAHWLDAQGNPTWDDRHCIPQAQRDEHLSRVAYVSRGASAALRRAGVPDLADLATRSSSDPALDDHHVLRGSRTVVCERASVLHGNGQAAVAPTSGTSAVMPRWADLRIHISTDFDTGSAVSLAFAATAFWVQPVPFAQRGQGVQRNTNPWPTRTFIVDTKSIATEERELLAFLGHIDSILSAAHGWDAQTTVQFYVWDQLELKHFSRVVGRHLQAILADRNIQHLAWLFPSEELVANPQLVARRSPVTVVRDVVRAVVAAPVAHYYSLLELARNYHHAGMPANLANFSVHPLFEDPLSDQIPSERAHEIWSRSTRPPWLQQLAVLQETIEKRIRALDSVRRRLEDDLGTTLGQTAPRIQIGALRPLGGIAFDSELWRAFAKLNAALDELDVAQVRAMPSHEREAKYRSARLEVRLHGADEAAALAALDPPLAPDPGLRVYRLRDDSREIKLREGDFSFALAPEDQPGFLDRSLAAIVAGTPLSGLALPPRPPRMEDVTSVTVVAIDRDNLNLVVRPSDYWPTRLSAPTLLDDLEAQAGVDLSRDVVLDPVHKDFFVRKLETTLRAIGNPPSPQGASLAVRLATGASGRRGARRSPHTPPADVLWDAATMHSTRIGRNTGPARQTLEAHGIDLNASQWRAWEEALTRRLQPIWGPPGTGKSRTMRSIALGAVVEAMAANRPLRLLICASTYTAVDNVLLEVNDDLGRLVQGAGLEVHRLRSYVAQPDPNVPLAIDRELNKNDPSPEVRDLRTRLTDNTGVTVIGATPEQVHNLLVVDDESAQQQWFDLILLDEASQTDVAHAVLPLAGLAAGGAVVPAGDPRQLPPIHQAEPPAGLDAMVGSVYRFIETVHAVQPVPLEENYRSNDTIVEFARQGGYRRTLRSVSPDLRLDLDPAPTTEPVDWPNHLHWTPEWDALLSPSEPAAAFIYDDETWSSQWNRFEADAVASLLVAARERLMFGLLNEIDPATGQSITRSTRRLMTDEEFWGSGVGVVTPHRAQQGLVLSALERTFPSTPTRLLRDAVDTVERFQGQQRDIMIATFALGDPDAIREEDEFLLGFNRFNVVASRARAKLIVLVSEQVVEHLSDDVDTLHASRLLKLYANSFCDAHREVTLGHIDGANSRQVVGQMRWRS